MLFFTIVCIVPRPMHRAMIAAISSLVAEGIGEQFCRYIRD